MFTNWFKNSMKKKILELEEENKKLRIASLQLFEGLGGLMERMEKIKGLKWTKKDSDLIIWIMEEKKKNLFKTKEQLELEKRIMEN